MTVFKGIPASRGIALAKCYKFDKHIFDIDKTLISNDKVEHELSRFKNSKLKAKTQIQELINKLIAIDKNDSKIEIFNAHLEIIDDPMLSEAVELGITEDKKQAPYSLHTATQDISSMLLNLDDIYLRERVADIKDISSRIMYSLHGSSMETLENLEEECIVIARDLTPSDTGTMDTSKVMGFATDIGGKTSHTSIIAKTLEIPAVVGMGNIFDSIEHGSFIILDGFEGQLIMNPNQNTIDRYKIKKSDHMKYKELLLTLKDMDTITLDNKKVELAANIGAPKEAKSVIDHNADAIGLFRTEFLYMDNTDFPTENEQTSAYTAVADAMGERAVIIRTLDIGGDKGLNYYDFPKELNPFLGYRAIRISLDQIDLFKTQLRAILRASAFGNLKIMFPMVISLDELKKSKSILEDCKAELDKEGIEYDKDIQVGIMIETPASVMLADRFAKICDFFSIGTNDLTQYTLAVDRDNKKISHLYNSFNPSVLLSIKKVIDAAHKEGKWVGMCGELASDERAAMLLIGLGLDELSMSTSSILPIKDLIRKIKFTDMQELANKVLSMDSEEEIENYLNNTLSIYKKS